MPGEQPRRPKGTKAKPPRAKVKARSAKGKQKVSKKPAVRIERPGLEGVEDGASPCRKHASVRRLRRRSYAVTRSKPEARKPTSAGSEDRGA